MEFAGYQIQFVSKIIHVKYLIGSIGHILQKYAQLNIAFSLLHILNPLWQAGATMRQLDTPEVIIAKQLIGTTRSLELVRFFSLRKIYLAKV